MSLLQFFCFSELDQPRKSVQFSEAVQVKTVEEPQEVEINEEKIDRWAEKDLNDSLRFMRSYYTTVM